MTCQAQWSMNWGVPFAGRCDALRQAEHLLQSRLNQYFGEENRHDEETGEADVA